MRRRRSLLSALLASTTLAAAAVLAPGAALPAAAAFAANDYCLGECSDILPPGENGDADLLQILASQAFGSKPPHSDDQLAPYANLVYNYTGLTGDQINNFFNDSSYGVAAADVESTKSPRSDVTIVRDKKRGIPHITGTTRAGTMYGAGYAGAQDRLFVMDLMRHVARGKLTPFAGGAAGNRALEQSVWRNSPYTEADLQAQVDRLRASGTRGAQLFTDVQSYLAGINKYIDDCMAARDCPGEYVLTGHLDSITNVGGPEDFVITDLVAIAGVIGGLFGGGGGTEMQSALVRIASRAKYGNAVGDQVWQQFRAQNDPEAVLTLHNGQSFPYGQGNPDAAGVAMPDPGTATPQPIVFDKTGSAATAASGTSAIADSLGTLTLDSASRGMSNAAVVSAAHSATGHPVAVFGPQTGYFAPQLLMLQELQGPGISSRGIAFSGLNLYTLIGRGPDYAWSATSSIQDITDTYAVKLCNTDGSAATLASTGYVYHGQCLAMENLTQQNAWAPTTADSTAAGSYRLTVQRTRYGLVTWRGLVGGAPTAFTSLRSTYQHEADSAIGFQMFNEPDQMSTVAAFTNSAASIAFAFNWFYVNSADSAMFTSGAQPVRASGADPNLPNRAEPAYEWAGWDPIPNTATYQVRSAHPQAVNQDYFISWNNKQAANYSAADGNFSFSAVHRGDLLDRPLKAGIAAGQKYDRAALLKLVQNAAVVDLRGAEVLPDLLRVIDTATVTDSAQAAAVTRLRSWLQSGAKRVETSANSKTYQHAEAIRNFDAWWPRLVQAQFQSSLGNDLFQSLVNTLQINESPSGKQTGPMSTLPTSANEAQAHKGSAFQYGWWGWVDKDLRATLGDAVPNWPRKHCGAGTLSACRTALLTSLSGALAEPAATTYPADDHCAAGNQWCADAVLQSPLGGIEHTLTPWQNRPTYQQVVSFPAKRGDDISNLAAAKPVTSSSAQSGHPATNVVDGSLTSRWASDWSDNQWVRVDLGTARTVSRVLVRWESAYATAYRIETSADGTTWTQAAAVSGGNGGLDTVVFPARTARYLRLTGQTRATTYGFSAYELEVYAR
ncbi:penicillin acylase family protein [Paractinoplanes rishiriensis]|uniref:Penicillin acylase n=1 Tax=Paractinoplanes rishiriensis TaxID=1050105 RepID=A0A919N090_9ACTN|nr:penicillin acylase family protein [Actinoplanes rishiriensis]GIE99320.1 penicillin acylase [Actinoplanes rishiriensis]